MTFEQAISELESITQQLNNPQLPLEQALNAYAKGCELVQFCQRELSEVEQKIQVLENDTLKELNLDNL